MQKRLLILILIASLCSSCAAPTRLGERDIRSIYGISLAIDTTLAHDVSGNTDTIDLPASMKITNKLLEFVTKALTAKGFHITDHHRSVGMAEPGESYYVLATKKDRKRKPSQLQRRRGPFYSDRLNATQLVELYKNIAKARFDSNPSIANLGFAGDTTLLIQVRGRTIGSGKRIASALGNIAIFAGDIFLLTTDGTAGFDDFIATDNIYYVYIRMYRTRDGEILWQRDFESHNVKEVLKKTVSNIRDRIPAKPGIVGH